MSDKASTPSKPPLAGGGGNEPENANTITTDSLQQIVHTSSSDAQVNIM